jgi:hypothetical protein
LKNTGFFCSFTRIYAFFISKIFLFLHLSKKNNMITKFSLLAGTLIFFSVSLTAQEKNVPQEKKRVHKVGDLHPVVAEPVVKEPAVKVSEQEPTTKMTAQQQKEQKAWMDYMTPGPMHKMIMASTGNWHEDLTFWMAPGAPPTKAESECNNKMILGDRYQESIHTGMMMGMPFEGRGTLGYDNVKKTFQSSWIDNMGTGIMYMEGKYNEAGKSITLYGKSVDPMTGKQERAREVFKFIDDKNQFMEMYMTKDGKEFKTMEIKFTKKE